MNRLAIAASMIAVTVSRARAADLPTQFQTRAPLIASGFRWSGFYIGGNGEGMLTSDASARDWLTGLPFHGCISKARGTVSPGCHNKAGYRPRVGQSGFRQSAKDVFIGSGPELAGGRWSDWLAA